MAVTTVGRKINVFGSVDVGGGGKEEGRHLCTLSVVRRLTWINAWRGLRHVRERRSVFVKGRKKKEERKRGAAFADSLGILPTILQTARDLRGPTDRTPSLCEWNGDDSRSMNSRKRPPYGDGGHRQIKSHWSRPTQLKDSRKRNRNLN